MEILPHEKQIYEYEQTVEKMKQQSELFSKDELNQLEKKLNKLKKKIYASLSPWERIQICRHPSRPQTSDYIHNLFSPFVELFGDRTFGDDPAVIGGLGRIGEMKCVVVGQEKGRDTETRLKRNFGMVHPEGFRKALRLARLAEKFSLPLVFFIDTPGAYSGLTAEERGQGWAIAMNLRELSRIATPIVVVVIGEGCSGGALGMGVGDAVGMLEHAYYSVISPEACASILWKDATKKCDAAKILKIHAEELLEFKVIDAIIKEPLGGAHHHPEEMYIKVKAFIHEQMQKFKGVSKELLLEHRYQKFRNIGRFDETFA